MICVSKLGLPQGFMQHFSCSMISELFIVHLPSQGCPSTAALMPQNFTVIDLRHHFAAGGLLDGLHGVAVVQDIAKIQILPSFSR